MNLPGWRNQPDAHASCHTTRPCGDSTSSFAGRGEAGGQTVLPAAQPAANTSRSHGGAHAWPLRGRLAGDDLAGLPAAFLAAPGGLARPEAAAAPASGTPPHRPRPPPPSPGGHRLAGPAAAPAAPGGPRGGADKGWGAAGPRHRGTGGRVEPRGSRSSQRGSSSSVRILSAAGASPGCRWVLGCWPPTGPSL